MSKIFILRRCKILIFILLAQYKSIGNKADAQTNQQYWTFEVEHTITLLANEQINENAFYILCAWCTQTHTVWHPKNFSTKIYKRIDITVWKRMRQSITFTNEKKKFGISYIHYFYTTLFYTYNKHFLLFAHFSYNRNPLTCIEVLCTENNCLSVWLLLSIQSDAITFNFWCIFYLPFECYVIDGWA